MTYKEKFGSLKNYRMVCAKHYLETIHKDGYKYYARRCDKHIDLLTYPEIYMTEEELEAKKKALQHIKELEAEANGNMDKIDPFYLMEWDYFKDAEWPEWRQ